MMSMQETSCLAVGNDDFEFAVNGHETPLGLAGVDRVLPGLVKGLKVVIGYVLLVGLADPCVDKRLQILHGRHGWAYLGAGDR